MIYILNRGTKYIRSQYQTDRGRRAHDHMVIGFTTTYAITAYYHWCCEFKSRLGRGVQHYVIKFVSDLRKVGGFLWVLRFPPKVEFKNIIKQTNKLNIKQIVLKEQLKFDKTQRM